MAFNAWPRRGYILSEDCVYPGEDDYENDSPWPGEDDHWQDCERHERRRRTDGRERP